MKLLEILIALSIIAILASGAVIAYSLSLPNNSRSALTTLYALKQARILALTDSTTLGYKNFGDIYLFARVDSERLLSLYEPFFWQIQFHTSGIYTKNSLSIYRDTPRFADTTDFDRRPMAGDILALSLGNSQCLSGYNNTNTAKFCKNNTLFDFRLNESVRLQNLSLNPATTCQERDTFRFYFNDFGKVLCGQKLHTPNGLQEIKVGNFIILLEPNTGYAFFAR